MAYSSRFFLYAPLTLLLLLAALAGVHWWLDASALDKRLDAANGREIVPGATLSFSGKRIAGFPFRLDVILKNLRIEVRDTDGPVIWTAQDFAMHALTYGRTQAIFEAAGPQTLAWRDARGAAHRFDFLPGSFRASAIVADGKLNRFDGEIVDLDGADFRAADLQFHARAQAQAIQVYFQLQRARISSGYAAALGADLESLTLNAALTRPNALDRLLRGAEPPARALDDWRGQGRIDVVDLSLTRGRQHFAFKGALALDAHHDLEGTLPATAGTGVIAFQGKKIELAGSALAAP